MQARAKCLGCGLALACLAIAVAFELIGTAREPRLIARVNLHDHEAPFRVTIVIENSGPSPCSVQSIQVHDGLIKWTSASLPHEIGVGQSLAVAALSRVREVSNISVTLEGSSKISCKPIQTGTTVGVANIEQKDGLTCVTLHNEEPLGKLTRAHLNSQSTELIRQERTLVGSGQILKFEVATQVEFEPIFLDLEFADGLVMSTHGRANFWPKLSASQYSIPLRVTRIDDDAEYVRLHLYNESNHLKPEAMVTSVKVDGFDIFDDRMIDSNPLPPDRLDYLNDESLLTIMRVHLPDDTHEVEIGYDLIYPASNRIDHLSYEFRYVRGLPLPVSSIWNGAVCLCFDGLRPPADFSEVLSQSFAIRNRFPRVGQFGYIFGNRPQAETKVLTKLLDIAVFDKFPGFASFDGQANGTFGVELVSGVLPGEKSSLRWRLLRALQQGARCITLKDETLPDDCVQLLNRYGNAQKIEIPIDLSQDGVSLSAFVHEDSSISLIGVNDWVWEGESFVVTPRSNLGLTIHTAAGEQLLHIAPFTEGFTAKLSSEPDVVRIGPIEESVLSPLDKPWIDLGVTTCGSPFQFALRLSNPLPPNAKLKCVSGSTNLGELRAEIANDRRSLIRVSGKLPAFQAKSTADISIQEMSVSSRPIQVVVAYDTKQPYELSTHSISIKGKSRESHLIELFANPKYSISEIVVPSVLESVLQVRMKKQSVQLQLDSDTFPSGRHLLKLIITDGAYSHHELVSLDLVAHQFVTCYPQQIVRAAGSDAVSRLRVQTEDGVTVGEPYTASSAFQARTISECDSSMVVEVSPTKTVGSGQRANSTHLVIPYSTPMGIDEEAKVPIRTIMFTNEVSEQVTLLRTRIRALAARLQSSVELDNPAWLLAHSLLVFQNKNERSEDALRDRVLSVLFDVSDAKRSAVTKKRGKLAAKYVEKGFYGQHHRDQVLCYMSHTGLTRQSEIEVNGVSVSVEEMLRESMMNVRVGGELSWTIPAYANFGVGFQQWNNKYGERLSFNELVQELFDNRDGTCGSTHWLQAVASAKNYLAGTEFNSLLSQADNILKQGRTSLRMNQYSDGHFQFLTEDTDPLNRVFDDKILYTGHSLEWLVMHLENGELKEDWVVSAVQALVESIERRLGKENLEQSGVRGEEIFAQGNLYHAMSGLIRWSAKTHEASLQ